MALAASVPHEAEVVTPASTSHAEPPADYTRVAKILVNMKPAEAGAILEHLGDAQVEGVLRAVGPRQAATLLTALPAERAAQISKRLLVPVTEEKRP
jgi:flagellar motility protein MotE (MotC chaperone)